MIERKLINRTVISKVLGIQGERDNVKETVQWSKEKATISSHQSHL